MNRTTRGKKKETPPFRQLAMAAVVILVLVAGFGVGRLMASRNHKAARPASSTAAASLPAVAPGETAAAPLPTAAVPQSATLATPFRGSSAPVPLEQVPVEPGQPRIWVNEISAANDFTLDLGTIPGQEVTERVFTVSNIGQGILVIQGVDATCGCSAAAIGKDTLAPGESTSVQFSYDPRTYGEQGKQIVKSFLVRSNDPLVPLAEVKITALVADS